jgi:hypothetical protein
MSVETCLIQFQISNMVLRANVGDVTHEESLIMPKPAGNCLNWVLGHLVATRSNFLAGIGEKPPWNEADCKHYDRHGPPLTNPADAKPLDEIWRALDETLRGIQETISKFTPDQLAAKAPFSPTNNPDETLTSLVTTFAFHDAYHAGQTGILRRIIGRPPADL